MDLLHIIAVAILVIIGIAIYINKRNGSILSLRMSSKLKK